MTFDSLFYTFMAILGLGFLIFIHELGHYWMARRVGMRVDTFAIGFGRPIISWIHDGVKWQIGWLPFGGYVKIAGSGAEPDIDPYSIPDGFYGKGPWNRIKVAFMGPLVNLVFAFIAFGFLWSFGGRDKNYGELTAKIGWVDPQSELFAKGVRAGDEVISYDGHPFRSAADHMYAIALAGDEVEIKLNKENYRTGEKTPVILKLSPYQHPLAQGSKRKTLGVISPAHYLIYNRLPNNKENPLLDGSPMKASGIEYGDRVLWVDGELIFSNMQLEHLLNDGRVLLTIERDGKTSLVRAPRVQASDLKLDPAFKEELIDWQYEAQLSDSKMLALYTLPYNLTNDAVVEHAVSFIDREKQAEAFPQTPYSALEESLQPGDRIIAVDGIPVQKSYQLIKNLQKRHVNIIVQRNSSVIQKVPYKNSDTEFDRQVDWDNLERITSSIGLQKTISKAGDLILMKPVTPLPAKAFFPAVEMQAALAAESKEAKKEIEAVKDPARRAHMLARWKPYEERMLLGLPYQDRKVSYNPSAMELFTTESQNLGRVFLAIFEKPSSRDWLSGPVGIVKTVHDSWSLGYKEALFWLGLISLNLGVLNLLPIPLLDGGTIVFSFYELVTRKRIKSKTLERLIVPFAILLIGFFIYVTYNDILRMLGLWGK